MRHKPLCTLLATIALVASASGQGETAESGILDDQQFAEARRLLQAERANIIRDELRLSDAESAAFWPVYDRYRADVSAIRDRQAELFGRFLKARQAGTIDDEFASGLIDDHFDIKTDILKTQKRYLRQFRKVLSELKVARFYQLENKMDAKGDAELAFFVPLVE